MRKNKAKRYSGLEIKPEGKFFFLTRMSITEKTVTFMFRKVSLLLADKGLWPREKLSQVKAGGSGILGYL